MELTIFDRLIILNQVLRKYDTRENILTKKSIDGKIKLLTDEKEVVKLEYLPNNQVDISFKTADAITRVATYDFTDAELLYMRESVYRINASGMYSEETMSAYDKIMEASAGIDPVEQTEIGG
jgi:hypothetical protein